MEDKKIELSNEFNNNKKGLISFAKINKYFIFPFLLPIFCMLAEYFSNEIYSTNKIIKDYLFSIIIDI